MVRRLSRTRLLCVVTLVALVVVACATFTRALAVADRDAGCISEIALAQGQDGIAELEGAGYTVMARPLCEKGDVYVGYRRSGTAITGVALAAGSGSFALDGANYGTVSDLDVFGGLKGAGCLAVTSDAAAGTGVTSMVLASQEGDEPLEALRNDGSVPMRDQAGHVVDLGIDAATYLFLYPRDIVLPYIGEACVVGGADRVDAIRVAAESGFAYYYDPGLSGQGGEYLLIAYNRTSDENEAITCVTARPPEEDSYAVAGVTFERMGDVTVAGERPYRLYCTRDRAAGNPVVDFTGADVPVRDTDVMGLWAERTFVKFASPTAGQQAKGEERYAELVKSTEGLCHVSVVLFNDDTADGQSEMGDAADATAGGTPEDVIELSADEDLQPREAEPTATDEGIVLEEPVDDGTGIEVADAVPALETSLEPEAASDVPSPSSEAEVSDVAPEPALVEVVSDDTTQPGEHASDGIEDVDAEGGEEQGKRDPREAVRLKGDLTTLAYLSRLEGMPASLFAPKPEEEAAKKKAAEEKAAAEKKAAEEKAAAEKKAAEEKAAAEKKAAEEKAAAESKAAEEKAAEEKRLAEERAAEDKRIAEEQAAANGVTQAPDGQTDGAVEVVVGDPTTEGTPIELVELPLVEDTFDAATYLNEAPEPVVVGEQVIELQAASVFGEGAGRAVVVSLGMAVLGALVGFGVYKMRSRRQATRGGDDHE